MALASIPSPVRAVWRLGPLPVRAYALCVIVGIGVAVLVASRRYRRPGVILDVAAWAIPLGLVGALLHAVLLDTGHGLGHTRHALAAGVAALGVPGAVALGTAGAWIACRRARVDLAPVAGAAAPAVAFGLSVGCLGNWWTQQCYGRPSSWWWAVQISPVHRVPGYENYGTFQPVFLYQSLWDAALGLGVIWAARRLRLTGDRTFMLCAAGYAAGAFWLESLRIGPGPRALGLRYGAVSDLVVFVLSVVVLYLTRSRPSARTPLQPDQVPVVDDSSGNVIST